MSLNLPALVRPLVVFLAGVAFVACSSGGGSAAPTPAPTPSTSTAAASAAPAPSNGMPAGVTANMIALGDSLFHTRSCRNCHGPDAKGRQNGPDLTSGHFMHVNGTYEDFVRIITSGVPLDSIQDKSHTLAMRPRGGGQTPLTDDQVRAVAAYVWSLNHKA